MATAKVYTSVTNPDTGEVTHLKPGDTIPDGIKVGAHITADPDDAEDATPTEPVAGPSQSAKTPRQQKAADAEAKAAADAAKADAKADAKAGGAV